MNSIFLNHTTRIFCISGNLNDVYCTKDLQFLNFEELLDGYLRELNYKNVFFYNNVKEKIYEVCDENARGLNADRKKSFMKKKESEFPDWADKNMHEREAMALVISSLDDYVRNWEPAVKRKMSSLFNDWNNLDSDNHNILIFLEKNLDLQGVSRMLMENREWGMETLFFDDICGNNPMLKRNACLFMSYPRQDELSSLLEYFRIMGHQVVIGQDENGACRYCSLKIDYEYQNKEELVRILSFYSRESGRNSLKMIKESIEQEVVKQYREQGMERVIFNEQLIKRIYSDCNKSYSQISKEDLERMFEERKEWGNANDVIFGMIKSINKRRKHTEEKRERSHNYSIERMEYRTHAGKNRVDVPNFVLQGPPGVGKTEIANFIGRILQAEGVLRSGHTVVASRDKLVGQYVGSSAINTSKIIEEAQEGVLLIDEIYSLAESKEGDTSASFCKEVINTLVAAMTNKEYHICFIFAGYKNRMGDVWNMNEGLFDRFGEDSIIDIPEYDNTVIQKIFENDISKDKDIKFVLYQNNRKDMVEVDTEGNLRKDDMDIFFSNFYKDRNRKNYANARTVLNLSKSVKRNALNRVDDVAEEIVIKKEDFGDKCSLFNKRGLNKEQIYASLKNYPGLESNIRDLLDNIQAIKLECEDKEMEYPGPLHMIWKGNPGTGKSTAAKLVAQFYHELHIFGGNEPVYVDAGNIKGQYVGVAEENINRLMDEAKEKNTVLVIEEAYQLIDEHFGRAALNAMLNRMEDERKNFNVIFILYESEYESFLALNPGLESRLVTVEFKDYSVDELMKILDSMLESSKDEMDADAREELRAILEEKKENGELGKGNARIVRKMLDMMRQARYKRILSGSLKDEKDIGKKYRFIMEDIENAQIK